VPLLCQFLSGARANALQAHQTHGGGVEVPRSVDLQQRRLLAGRSRGQRAGRRPELGVAAASAGPRPARHDADVVLRRSRRADEVRASLRSPVRRPVTMVASALLPVSIRVRYTLLSIE